MRIVEFSGATGEGGVTGYNGVGVVADRWAAAQLNVGAAEHAVASAGRGGDEVDGDRAADVVGDDVMVERAAGHGVDVAVDVLVLGIADLFHCQILGDGEGWDLALRNHSLSSPP